MTELLRVVLCDDHGIVRDGLRRILEALVDVEVVGEASTASAALELVRTKRPAVMIIDVGLPDASGLECTRQILEMEPATRVLVLTVHDDPAYLEAAFAAGASGYLLKDSSSSELVRAVLTVASGDQYVQPRLGAELAGRRSRTERGENPNPLTARELEVLRLVALGYTNAATAEELTISVRTVETHRARITQKLGVSNRVQLVQRAGELGLLTSPAYPRVPGFDHP